MTNLRIFRWKKDKFAHATLNSFFYNIFQLLKLIRKCLCDTQISCRICKGFNSLRYSITTSFSIDCIDCDNWLRSISREKYAFHTNSSPENSSNLMVEGMIRGDVSRSEFRIIYSLHTTSWCQIYPSLREFLQLLFGRSIQSYLDLSPSHFQLIYPPKELYHLIVLGWEPYG